MSNPYESRRLVGEYLFFHYAGFEEAAGNLPVPREAWGFAERAVTELLSDSGEMESALDVGCAVGRSSFELARRAQRVVGVDYSRAFVDACKTIQSAGEMSGEDLILLDGALETLKARDERQHDVVMLRYFAGLTIEQTAAAMDLSPATVKNEWTYARAWLMREMEKARKREPDA
jgi:RNA polymerase sigma factor (sigma-70 family)